MKTSEKDGFSSCHERGTKKKFRVPMRKRTSDIRIPRSDAIPLSHRDSAMSEVYYEVLIFSLSIRRFVCQSKYFVSSVHRKKRVALLYQLSCSFEHELNCIRFVEELCPSFAIDLFSSESLIGFALNVALKKKYRCLHLKRSLLGRPC